MVVWAQSHEQLVNAALARIGHGERVGSLFEGSRAAKIALDVYGQVRDAVLKDRDWDFAERTTALTLLKSAPVGGYIPPTAWSSAYPPLPWAFEYAYPADCLKIRIVKQTPLFLINYDPVPNIWNDANDNSLTPPARVILTNLANAVLVYTGQITDPTTWSAEFVEHFTAALGRRLAPTLSLVDAGKLDMTKLEAAEETIETSKPDRDPR
jgi:hypothetical protein